ncbi:IS4 family transposase [Chryseobacterium sp. C-17]|uniref:IS4 family transposase n=2 Tax=Chryseobacterium turcicum TaxID=2898076 RepID=A0A9Q3YXA1_9FLAO|nr:IS4 family transposase [Chryseobacterium turcicum]
MKDKDFTRNRKQSFASTLLLMVNFLTKSLSLEIENFVRYLKIEITNTKPFTKSAFVQARKKISPKVFRHLSNLLVREFYTDNSGVALLEGFRILAVDGSRITLPITQELEGQFGRTTNQSDTYVIQAKVSVLYDVLNNFVIDGDLSPISIGEREMALKHLQHCKIGDLLIYDRGYPSFDFIFEHHQRGLDYLMRVKTDFSSVTKSFMKNGKTSEIVEINPGKNTKPYVKVSQKKPSLRVRIIRIELPNGQTELLITSLLENKKYTPLFFKKLYFKRWKIETFYDEFKNKLKIEHFSGYSYQSIMQDFFAALFVSNVQTLIIGDLNEEIKEMNLNKRYDYKINNNLSYGFMKDRIVGMFLKKQNTQDILEELKQLFKKHLIPIRPDRSNKRNVGKYRNRIKPKTTKNQKDTL